MEIVGVTENENGGATYTVELNSEEADEMCRNGIIWAIVSAATGITAEQVVQMYNESQEGHANYSPFEGPEYKTTDDYELGN